MRIQLSIAILLFGIASVTAEPPGTYDGFPTLDEGDGRFVAITRGADSLGDAGPGTTLRFTVAVDPADGDLISVWLYDGDISNNVPAGSIFDAAPSGHDDMRFDLYEDPDLTGATAVAVGSSALASTLNDVTWDEVINVSPLPAGALGSDGSGLYYFNLVSSWVTETPDLNEANRFKVASNGLVTLPEGSVIGLIGYGDIPALLVDTTYDGTFEFDAVFPNNGTIPCSLTIYHGDFDVADDDDSPKFSGIPSFPTSSETLSEGANPGNPPDDGPALVVIPPAVFFDVNGPSGSYSANVPNPSGNKEWEREIIYSEDPSCPVIPDPVKPLFTFVPQILPGAHQILVQGLDTANTIFVRVGQASVSAPGEEGDGCIPDAKLTVLTFRYKGGDCSASNNSQTKDECSGDDPGSPASIVFTKKENERTATPSSGIQINDEIVMTTTADWFKGDLQLEVTGPGGTQVLKIHVSCSEPLDPGDRFGSLELVDVDILE